MRRIALPLSVGIMVFVASCQPPRGANSSTQGNAIAASRASLTFEPRVLDDHRVELTVMTTLPLPVTVDASVNLADQAPDDTYIGYGGGRATLTQPRTVLALDTSGAQMPLPSADYIVEVTFNPRWGADGNAEAARAPELRAERRIRLRGSGQPRASAERRDVNRAWIMENVYPGTRWNRAEFRRRLGPFERSASTLSPLHDAYYFPDVDTTLIVNRLRNEVTIWRFGRVSQ